MLRALPPPLPRYLGSYLTSLSDFTFFVCVRNIFNNRGWSVNKRHDWVSNRSSGVKSTPIVGEGGRIVV